MQFFSYQILSGRLMLMVLIVAMLRLRCCREKKARNSFLESCSPNTPLFSVFDAQLGPGQVLGQRLRAAVGRVDRGHRLPAERPALGRAAHPRPRADELRRDFGRVRGPALFKPVVNRPHFSNAFSQLVRTRGRRTLSRPRANAA